MNHARGTVVVVIAVVALVVTAAPAFAHVGVEVDDNRPGARARYAVTVPNESETADTVEVQVELPEGFDILRHRPPPGWDMVDEDGVLTISGGALPPGASQDFVFVAVNPPEPGEVAFPAVQTYSDGEVVRWVGDPDTEHPAPVVTYAGEPVAGATVPPEQAAPAPTAQATTGPSPAPTETATATPTPTDTATAAPTATATPAPDRGDAGGPPLWLLIVIALAVVLALGAAAVWRRPDGET